MCVSLSSVEGDRACCLICYEIRDTINLAIELHNRNAHTRFLFILFVLYDCARFACAFTTTGLHRTRKLQWVCMCVCVYVFPLNQ